MMKTFSYCFLLIFLLVTAQFANANNLSAITAEQSAHLVKVFDSNAMKTIKGQYANQAFVLVVWSIDCLPCRDEFALFKNIKKQYPRLNLSIVAIENQKESPELINILKEYDLLKEDNWSFAENHSARLKHQVDPNWYGELPRTYFYNSRHTRLAVSGKLKGKDVIAWIKKQ